MAELQAIAPKLTLRRQYTRRLLRNIWRAMRVERLNFIQGRIPFESFVYDEVLDASASGQLVLPDGSAYDAPDAPIDGKTLENFIKKSSSIFDIDRTSSYQNIKTANKTLQYMHAFLAWRHPDRVARWKDRPTKLFDDLIVKNLDDSFRVFETRKTFPHGIKILDTSKAEPSVLSLTVADFFAHRDQKAFVGEAYTSSKTPLLAVTAFASVESDVLNRTIVLTPEQWAIVCEFHLEGRDIDKARHDLFDDHMMVARGVSISFQSRDYGMETIPAIPEHQSVCVFRFKQKYKGRIEYADIRIKELEPLKPFDNSEGGEIMVAAAQTEFHMDGEKHVCLPVHLSTEEERHLAELFEFLA